MYKLYFYVPINDKERVKKALFDLGVGRYGTKYDSCSFETLGTGQFRALDGADPYIGNIGEIETVNEYKVEMLCKADLIKEAIVVLKKHHPYEEVAFEVIKLEDF